MAEQQEHYDGDGRDDIKEELRIERKKRQECEQRVEELEGKLRRMHEKYKENEMKEQENIKREEKQKVCA